VTEILYGNMGFRWQKCCMTTTAAVTQPSSSDCSCDQNSENDPPACMAPRGF